MVVAAQYVREARRDIEIKICLFCCAASKLIKHAAGARYLRRGVCDKVAKQPC